MKTTELNEEFYKAYHQSTSGSAGGAILKLLHEKLEEHKNKDPFKALENSADVLQRLGRDDPHPWILGQICGAWDALLSEIAMEENMEDARIREQNWYIRGCLTCGKNHDYRKPCPEE
jgi:hypothetical protein